MLRVPLLIALTLLLSACATPVGVDKASQRDVYRQLTVNELGGDQPSAPTGQLLRRLNLQEKFDEDPAATLALLHAGLGAGDEDERLFALAELSYAYGIRSGSRAHYLAAAVYAYAFSLPPDAAEAPGRYDPRQDLALDFYNEALAAGLARAGSDEIDLSPRTADLPFGTLEIQAGQTGLTPYGYRLDDIGSSSRWLVRGLRNRYRRSGIGAPIVGQVINPDGSPLRWMGPLTKLPFTAVLRVPDARAGLRAGSLRGELELYDADIIESVRIDDYDVPVQSDATAALAYRLEGAPVWDTEIAGFRRSDLSLTGEAETGHLYMLYPYRRGRIPVVFVHGTASSPARWAEMANEILGDPRLDARYQLWFYQYNTGNPVAVSALYLREALQKIVAELDPEGMDPALCDMVVIGHSQGGLLTKMTVVSSGDAFWHLLSDKPFEEADLDDETRDFVRRAAFVEPLPCVRRVVFIATPHRGSYLADNILGWIARKLVTLPAALAKTGIKLMTLRPAQALESATSLPTSIDNMQASNPFLKTLVTLPPAPGVHAHSIIAVQGDGPVEEGDDGVVKYTSAHIDGVESQLVVRSSHSTQAVPETVEEVRRILLLHVTEE